MSRIALLLAAGLVLAASSAEAAHSGRATCPDRGSVLCGGSIEDSHAAFGHKLSHWRARSRAKSPIGAATGSVQPAGAAPIARATSAKWLAAREVDASASASDSGELTAPPASTGTPAWLQPVLFALAGSGILSLFLARSAEL